MILQSAGSLMFLEMRFSTEVIFNLFQRIYKKKCVSFYVWQYRCLFSSKKDSPKQATVFFWISSRLWKHTSYTYQILAAFYTRGTLLLNFELFKKPWQTFWNQLSGVWLWREKGRRYREIIFFELGPFWQTCILLVIISKEYFYCYQFNQIYKKLFQPISNQWRRQKDFL